MSSTGTQHFTHDPTDASRLLALDSRGARIIGAVFVAANFIFTVATLHMVAHPWPPLLAMILVNATAVLLMRAHPDPFPLRDAIIAVIVVVISTALVSWQLPTEGPPARSAWHLGANTWLMFFLALRRRGALAWLGLCLMTAVTVIWAVDTGRGVSGAITLVQVHFGILLVASLFAINLRRTSSSINALNERSVQSAASFAAADASQAIRQARFAELADAVVPLLREISREEPVTEGKRREFRAVEATLRDTVRGRSLTVPSVVGATRAARDRGVEVNLLDDRGETLREGAAMQRVSRAIVTILEGMSEGTATVRLLPQGREVSLSIVAHQQDHTTRVELDADGHPARRSETAAVLAGDVAQSAHGNATDEQR